MSREIINVGAVPNDGTGDPIRTAYIKCNNNFGELYSRAQQSPPATLVGTVGDSIGMYASDENSFYYCFADYDGSSIIWGQLADVGTPSSIANGNSSIQVINNGNITLTVGGINTGNISTSGLTIASVQAVGNIRGNILVSDTQIIAAGNITAGNVITTGVVASGNISGGNISATGIAGTLSTASQPNITSVGTLSSLTATGNVTGGNLVTAGRVVATGNMTAGNATVAGSVTSGYFIGDGSGLTNVPAAANVTVNQIANATSIISINGAGGSALFQVGGVANVAVVTAAGTYIEGLMSATGNVSGGNVLSTGVLNSFGNITGGNISTPGRITAAVSLSTPVGLFSGNVTGGNLITAGNVSGNYILGNGALLTGVITSVANINSGNSNVTVVSAGGPVSVGVGGVSNIAIWTTAGEYISGLLNVTGNANVGNIGAASALFTGNVSGGNITTAGLFTATGNITGGNLTTSGQATITGNANIGNISVTTINASGNISTAGNITASHFIGTISGNVDAGGANTNIQFNDSDLLTGSAAFTFNKVSNVMTLSGNANVGNIGATNGVFSGSLTGVTTINASGNITAGNLSVSTGTVSLGNIINTNANGVGNIGSSTTYFNTIFAQATSAQYADLAEYYQADQPYPPGTVLKFGEITEVTLADLDHDPTVIGVVSQNPAFVMNSGLIGENVVAIALMGRTVCQVVGPVRKGQMMVSAGNGHARAEMSPGMGTVIGKSLENFSGDVGVIEILVGKT